MSTHSMPRGAGSAVPENGEGCDPAKIAPFWTDENSHPNCAKAATECKVGAPGTGAKIIARRASTEAQYATILSLLRTGEKTTFDLRRAGVMDSSARICELRRKGYNIATVCLRTLYDGDGHAHRRVAVYALLGEPEGGASVLPDVRSGTERAKIVACGVRSRSGRKRTSEDKRRSVAAVMKCAEWSKLSDREIARHCKVSHTFVASQRKRYMGDQVGAEAS
ncbi:MAG: helix-turn-helix domain-containing protein [Rubrivivax sp.]|nr:helix-turn-helix domain-containing protein [Rubrivivax sp.]